MILIFPLFLSCGKFRGNAKVELNESSLPCEHVAETIESARPGAIIKLPSTTCHFTVGIRVPSNVTIVGSESAKLSFIFPEFVPSTRPGLILSKASNVHLSNFSIELGRNARGYLQSSMEKFER